MRSRIPAFILSFACAWTSCATAAEPVADSAELKGRDLALRAQLKQRMDEIMADKDKYAEALVSGELRSTLCKVCHGQDGTAVRPGVPNLAGQSPVYIVDQFNRYADGRRVDFWMGSLAKNFTDEDKIKLAIYYAQQPLRAAGGGDATLVDRGKELFQAFCVECHGDDAKSSEGYAHLAGQRPEYTVKMLKEFKTAEGRRYNPWMYARANMLKSDTDIEAVAAYLAQLE